MSLKNKILPLIAGVGLVSAIAVAVSLETKRAEPKPIALPAQAPFLDYLGGSGMVEASTNNISIGNSVAGIVKEVLVKVGDKVTAGMPLFLVDDREYRADLAVKEANRDKARAGLAEAQAALQDYRTQYAMVKGVTDGRTVSLDEVERRRNAERLAAAKVDSTQAALAVAEAEVKAVRTNMDRLAVRAPIDGEILQLNVRPGEYAPTGALANPLVRLGNLDRLHVRVDIDENDAWRFMPQTKAVAYIRGNRALKADLEFVRVEPFVVPKASLTGGSSERVDTRVLQVIYAFERSLLPAFVGQQVDVFIDIPAPPPAKRVIGDGTP